jgi:hypothetical protein
MPSWIVKVVSLEVDEIQIIPVVFELMPWRVCFFGSVTWKQYVGIQILSLTGKFPYDTYSGLDLAFQDKLEERCWAEYSQEQDMESTRFIRLKTCAHKTKPSNILRV